MNISTVSIYTILHILWHIYTSTRYTATYNTSMIQFTLFTMMLSTMLQLGTAAPTFAHCHRTAPAALTKYFVYASRLSTACLLWFRACVP